MRRELRRFDTILFLMSAMVVVDTIGAIAIGGAQAFTWLVILFVAFFIPSALISAELGSAIPEEGGVYVWVRMAFGRYAGALASLLYWAGTPMWLGGSVTVVAIAVFGRFFTPLSTLGMLVFGIVFVSVATVGAVLPLRYGKWFPSSGAIGQIVLLSVFTVSVLLYGAQHGVHGLRVGSFAPSTAIFIAIVPILLYSFVGVELPSTAGEEMMNPQRDIPGAILRAGIAQALMYGVPILAVLFVLPADQVTSLHGLIDAMGTVFTVFGGSVAADGSATLTGAGQAIGSVMAALFIWVLVASGSAWIMGAGRAQAAACIDGAGPAFLGRVSGRTGVPVVMGLVSGAVSLVAMVVYVVFTGGNGQRYFSASLTVSIVLILLAYLLVFPSFLRLRFARPDLERPFRVPGGTILAVVVTVASTAWALLAAVCLLWPGFGTSDPASSLPAGFEGDRWGFELHIVVPLAILALASWALFVSGSREVRSGDR
ncbi:MAG TPA: APC family permease [Actinomycetota bacterium]